MHSQPIYRSYSLVIVRNKQNKYLAVLETGNKGWWLTGGHRQNGQTFKECAVREVKQEGGVDIELKGIIKMANQWGKNNFRQWVIFYGQPKDHSQKPKDFADAESIRAEYLTLDQIQKLQNKRGYELQHYAQYIEKGGQIHPLSLLEE